MINRFYKRSTFLFVFAAFAMVISGTARAQTDSLTNNFQDRFQNNLNELQLLFELNDTTLYGGSYKLNTIDNIEAELQKLNLPVFTATAPKAESFYRFFNQLNRVDKQNLLRTFAFYETEFEKKLRAAKLPVELKYLAPALSAMNWNAVENNKKAGVWQLTHFQAFLNGLNVSRLVDERFSVSLATTAAISQLKTNLELFRDLNLAVAAFWLGNVKVKNAIELAKESGKEITRFFPEKYFENVAAFQAMALFLSKNKFIPAEEFTKKLYIDTVTIHRQMHFRQISQAMQIPIGKLQFFNPKYRFYIVPGNEQPMLLNLPAGTKILFTQLLDSIYNCYDSTLFKLVTQKIEYPPSPNRQYLHEPVKDLEIEGKTKIKYRIKSGDVLGIIAEDFEVRVADLKYWNNIYNERKIRAGSNLDIFVDTDKVDYYRKLAGDINSDKKNRTTSNGVRTNAVSKHSIPANAQKIEHIVKNGESPYTIAKKYKGVTPDEILEWNNIDNARKIQIGQKLIIYAR